MEDLNINPSNAEVRQLMIPSNHINHFITFYS